MFHRQAENEARLSAYEARLSAYEAHLRWMKRRCRGMKRSLAASFFARMGKMVGAEGLVRKPSLPSKKLETTAKC